MIKAIGITRVTCGNCGKCTDYDVSSMAFKEKNSATTYAEEYEALAEIECAFCHSKIPYKLAARRPSPGGPIQLSRSFVGATADPHDITRLRLHEL